MNEKNDGLNKWIKVNEKKKRAPEKNPAKNDLDVKALENWLWEGACTIRGDIDAPKYKDYILPLIFIKRLSDVFEDEIGNLIEEYGTEEIVSIAIAGNILGKYQEEYNTVPRKCN